MDIDKNNPFEKIDNEFEEFEEYFYEFKRFFKVGIHLEKIKDNVFASNKDLSVIIRYDMIDKKLYLIYMYRSKKFSKKVKDLKSFMQYLKEIKELKNNK